MLLKNEKLSIKIILLAILLLAIALRSYNLNWDSGFLFHPDERAILMTVMRLDFPTSLNEFFSPQSPWNTNFFAYGSFPFYLLRITANLLNNIDPVITTYLPIHILGRFLSVLSDIGTILILFLLGRKLFSAFVGLTAAFFYTISVLPIQLAHFFAVDSFLTFFTLAVLYALVLFYEKPNVKKSFIIGILLGFAAATKISAIVLLVSVGTALVLDFFLIFFRKPYKSHAWIKHAYSTTMSMVIFGIIIGLTTLITFFILNPYAFIDFNNFWNQTQLQAAMTKSAFTFPYTLQYVGKIPYLYELSNIYFFGLGPILATLSFAGCLYFIIFAFQKEKTGKWAKEIIIIVFFLSYVFVVGRFAVGWIRYMLPVYPLFALFAAFLTDRLLYYLKLSKKSEIIFMCLAGIILLIWPISFVQIYTRDTSRVTASNWIYENIPQDKVLAIEHWDDPLPIGRPVDYRKETLALYERDTDEKWQKINNQLKETDYIILASNRLYIPLQKLTDCKSLPEGSCYRRTAEYYRNLFSGKLGFIKVAEFTSHPTIPLINIPINDQGADESFTVIDHPKIIIFRKI